MADYKKLKAHYAEMKAFWNEGEEVLNIVVDKDKILKDIEVRAAKATVALKEADDKWADAEIQLDKLQSQIAEKGDKVNALDKYLAGGFKAQEAEMKRKVDEHLTKLKGDGEKKLEGLRGDIAVADDTLNHVLGVLDAKEKRVDELEKRLQEIKDGILA